MADDPRDDDALAHAAGTAQSPPPKRAPWLRRGHRRVKLGVLGAVAVIVGGAAIGWVVLTSSPEPGAALIREQLNAQSVGIRDDMAAIVDRDPAVRDVSVVQNQPYRSGDAQALLDVYSPGVAVGEATIARPTIVWVHGGGWLAGTKTDWAPYYRLLASKGFAVVSVGYGLAPEHPYPRAVNEVNAALGYVVREARRLHVDPDRLVLAGDSAGAQLASQVAALTTNPAFAKQLAIEPAIEAKRLRGVLLHSGVYDAEPFTDQDVSPGGPVGFGIATLMWAYAGTKDWDSAVFDEMSTIDFVTADYPPTFITAGNDDALTAGQSRPFAMKLQKLGVPTETAFYPPNYRPKLPHEFQFGLDTDAAQDVLQRTVRWVRTRTDD
jgi:acetyl esterase/lipase